MPKSAKNGQNLPLLDQKIQNFEFSHRYHYSYTLEDTQEKILGSFQSKLMTKFKVISQKPSKNWIFGQNGHFLTVFGQIWQIFEFFSKIRLEHFFTFPKPYLTAKFQKKIMNGCLDNCVTDIRTYVHTRVNLQVCLRRDQKHTHLHTLKDQCIIYDTK